MPTVKLSESTKKKLESAMAESLRLKMESAKGTEQKEFFVQLIQKKYGISYDKFIMELLENNPYNPK